MPPKINDSRMETPSAVGVCPLCSRDMYAGPSVNEHHLVPKTFGGKVKILIHRICHHKIHSIFSERELQKTYNTIDSLKSHSEIQKFIAWLKYKHPTFYHRNESSKSKK
jgi:hypothetical protein